MPLWAKNQRVSANLRRDIRIGIFPKPELEVFRPKITLARHQANLVPGYIFIIYEQEQGSNMKAYLL